MKKRGKDIAKLQSIINSLVQRNPLGPQHRDHALTGELKGSRDCHVEPDWILIYEQKLDELILFRTGSHSDLFS
jgi:mRNA interferase YafQ